jgi:hypothetical protein
MGEGGEEPSWARGRFPAKIREEKRSGTRRNNWKNL